MSFKCGIIGLPNVGKSTIFNAITNSNCKSENYPFCTIKPNVKTIFVPDKRLCTLAKIAKVKHMVFSNIEFIDIAGLIEGASKGVGIGNSFLNTIRDTDAILHVVRCFEDSNIIHVTGHINPSKDINIINTELILADMEVCERCIVNIKKTIQVNDKIAKQKLFILEKCLYHLNKYNMLGTLQLSNEEKTMIKNIKFLTIKPIMYIANVNKHNLHRNEFKNEILNMVRNEGFLTLELNLSKEYKFPSLIDECYKLLNLQTFFTINKKEVRAWSIPIGTNALQAANLIHSDFKKGFINVKTIKYDDFVIYNGISGVKTAGKYISEGKEYIIKDGDILNFLFKV